MPKKLFEYEPLPQLAAAQERLSELKRQANYESPELAELHRQAAEAYDRMLTAETAVALGQADREEYDKALKSHETIRARVDKIKTEHGPDRETLWRHISALSVEIELLKEKEATENLKRFKPLYVQAVKKLDDALGAAAKANEELLEIQEMGGSLSLGWPGYWTELSSGYVNGNKGKLAAWRERLRQYSVLD